MKPGNDYAAWIGTTVWVSAPFRCEDICVFVSESLEAKRRGGTSADKRARAWHINRRALSQQNGFNAELYAEVSEAIQCAVSVPTMCTVH